MRTLSKITTTFLVPLISSCRDDVASVGRGAMSSTTACSNALPLRMFCLVVSSDSAQTSSSAVSRSHGVEAGPRGASPKQQRHSSE